MVGPLGHYGAALLAASVIVYGLRRKEGLLFTLFVLLAAMLPDVDTPLPWFVHHGVTHTIAFGVGVAVVGGLLVTASFVVYQRVTGRYPGEPTAGRVLTLAVPGLFVGVLSHLAADALTILPPGTLPIRPFWPVVARPVRFELLAPFSHASNVSLLLVGGAAWALAFATARPTRDPEGRLKKSS